MVLIAIADQDGLFSQVEGVSAFVPHHLRGVSSDQELPRMVYSL